MISNAARKNAGAGLPTISAFTSQANCKIWFIKYCNNEEEKTGKSNIDESVWKQKSRSKTSLTSKAFVYGPVSSTKFEPRLK